jgi:hypothetical protein
MRKNDQPFVVIGVQASRQLTLAAVEPSTWVDSQTSNEGLPGGEVVRVMDMHTAEGCVSTPMQTISYLVSRDCVCKLAVHGRQSGNERSNAETRARNHFWIRISHEQAFYFEFPLIAYQGYRYKGRQQKELFRSFVLLFVPRPGIQYSGAGRGPL